MQIIADDKILYIKGVLEEYATVVYKSGSSINSEDVKEADALLVRTRTNCDKQLLENSKVKFVATATIGKDHLDTEWLEKNGIEWINAPGCNSGSVMQYIASVFAHLILSGTKPEKTTVGIIGVGMVGKKIEKLAKTLGFKVLLNDPPRERAEKSYKFTDFETVISHSDILTFHTPLITDGEDKTYHLLNLENVKNLKKGAVVINSSRGEVTCSNALLYGLEKNIISKLVLDVWENEPQLNLELLDKVWFGTPHIAGYSADGKANGSSMVIQALSKKFNLPLNDWEPKNVPLPENTTISKPQKDEKAIVTVAKAILETYDIANDSKALKRNPDKFEEQRGNYPVRREFHIWELLAKENYGDEVWGMLLGLGFKISK